MGRLNDLFAMPVRIQAHMFVGSRAPWDHIGMDAPEYEARPPHRQP